MDKQTCQCCKLPGINCIHTSFKDPTSSIIVKEKSLPKISVGPWLQSSIGDINNHRLVTSTIVL